MPETRYLVTTTRSILAVPERGRVEVVHRGKGLYYGVTFDAEQQVCYVAARNSDPHGTNKFIESELEKGEILCFNQRLKNVGTISPSEFSLQDLHEIKWHEGRLICTSSFHDAIDVYDGSEWRRWQPLPLRDEKVKRDHFHWNSIFVADKFYFLAHNWDRGSFISGFDELFGAETVRHENMGKAAHNIWSESGTLYSLSSEEGLVRGTDGSKRDIKAGWIRGFCQTSDHYAVGVSGIASRENRHYLDAKIIRYTKNWESLGEIVLPEEGQILDIQVLPESWQNASFLSRLLQLFQSRK